MLVLLLALAPKAQPTNWGALTPKQNNIGSAWLGRDYGSTAGISYGRKISSRLPMMVGIDYSNPFGKQVPDDFKTTLNLQAEMLRVQHFSVSVKAAGLFRR